MGALSLDRPGHTVLCYDNKSLMSRDDADGRLRFYIAYITSVAEVNALLEQLKLPLQVTSIDRNADMVTLTTPFGERQFHIDDDPYLDEFLVP